MSYDPNRLLDTLRDRLHLRNDAALACMLETSRANVERIRTMKAQVSASMLIRMFEVTGISIRDLRDLMGDRRKKYRLSNPVWDAKQSAAQPSPQPAGSPVNTNQEQKP